VEARCERAAPDACEARRARRAAGAVVTALETALDEVDACIVARSSRQRMLP
jgi:hypothetical protein